METPPATPLELWSHVALVFSERNVPLPEFMAKLTDVAWARQAVASHRRELELAKWRTRFAQLEDSVTVPVTAPLPPLQTLRLRLAHKKPVWEISTSSPFPTGVAPPATAFQFFSTPEFNQLFYDAETTAFTFDAASNTVIAILRARQRTTNRTALKLTDVADCTFLARRLNHPLARTCVVDDAGHPIVRDPRRLVWQFRDHPTDPEIALAELAFADGTPVPAPLLHLPARPDLYLHGATLFTGLPPPAHDGGGSPDGLATPVAIPRAALALPEAGRFAARAGLALPNDTAGRFRHESLRPRLRAQLSRRRPTVADDEVLLVELAAIAPDGTPRALSEGGAWRRTGPGLPPPPPDAAFLIQDFEPTRAAVEQYHQLPTVIDSWHPSGQRIQSEITNSFAETFPSWLAGFPANTVIELAPELAGFAQAATRAHFAIDLTAGDETSGIDWFDVRVSLRAEDTTLTPEEIALLHGARGRFVRLAGRGWRRLTVEDSAATQEKLARLGLDPATAATETGREPLRFHALQLADEALREALPEKLWAQVRERAAALRSPAPPPTPSGLVADLRPYQHEGFHFLAFLSGNSFGGVLADDMGLGKTLQALTWLLWLADRASSGRERERVDGSESPRTTKPFRVLVVCPKSVVVNWQLETARFAPSLTTTAFTSSLVTPAVGGAIALLTTLDSHLLIANYTQLRLHANTFAIEAWDAVILDEGQNIKNPASATAQAARALRTAHRLVLTGTPIENRLLDLWSLFAFAQPGLLGGQNAFKRLYNDKADPTGARTRLAQRVRHFMLRRTKSQVARDLPLRIEEELVVELDGEQRRLYDAELKRTRQLLLGVKSAREFDTQRFNILQSLLRLRQICCDPRLVGATTADPVSAKLEALLDTVEPLVAEGHKVLVFSQFVTMLELIRDELNTRSLAHLMITGQTENRQALVDQFQTDPAISIFLLSLKAAGSGLNLTAASYVILYDPWWNPAVEAQAIDRTHRIGQKNQVMAYRLIARNTVEEKIRALQREKAALAAAVVQEESLANVLDLDSLRSILA
ncbi:MAG: DEAD/DEAH box helicase [Opitutus sp.]|nr:DEAD/DEAH box helicase [Opitutus sp.]